MPTMTTEACATPDASRAAVERSPFLIARLSSVSMRETKRQTEPISFHKKRLFSFFFSKKTSLVGRARRWETGKTPRMVRGIVCAIGPSLFFLTVTPQSDRRFHRTAENKNAVLRDASGSSARRRGVGYSLCSCPLWTWRGCGQHTKDAHIQNFPTHSILHLKNLHLSCILCIFPCSCPLDRLAQRCHKTEKRSSWEKKILSVRAGTRTQ